MGLIPPSHKAAPSHSRLRSRARSRAPSALRQGERRGLRAGTALRAPGRNRVGCLKWRMFELLKMQPRRTKCQSQQERIEILADGGDGWDGGGGADLSSSQHLLDCPAFPTALEPRAPAKDAGARRQCPGASLRGRLGDPGRGLRRGGHSISHHQGNVDQICSLRTA